MSQQDKRDDARIASLEDIWPLQAALNKRAGFDTQQIGLALAAASGDGSAQGQAAEGSDSEQGRSALLAAGRALKNYLDALTGECHELQECLSWKHWYKEAREGRQYELRDLQNARVEATDILFFWVSICQLLGLSPDDVYRLYAKKLGINHARQDEDRTQAQHADHEHENRNVV